MAIPLWKKICALVILAGLVVLAADFFYRVRVSQTRFMLGTQVSVVVLTQDKRAGLRLVEEVFEEIGRLELIYSDRKPESELYQINQQAQTHWVKVSPEMAAILNDSFRWHKKTGGKFDITVGALGQAWGFKTQGKGQVPDSGQLRVLVNKIGMDKVEWDSRNSRIRFLNPAIRLDLGGIAKLAILRAVDDFLRRKKQYEFLINLGGDVLAGQRGIIRKWQIGISDPKNPAKVILHLELEDSLVLTSGDYFRSFTQNGKTYHHILDPRTGSPMAGMNAVTLVMPNIQPEPVPSLAVFLLGPKAGMELIESTPSVEGVIMQDGKLLYSSGFHKLEAH